jgi:DNA-binding NtrC family response regulator
MPILVVDEDVGLQRALRRVLMSYGFEVEVAADGSETLERLRGRVCDPLVLESWAPSARPTSC